MKASLFSLLLAVMVSVVVGFSPSFIGVRSSPSSSCMTKKFPAGRPFTGQVDEDMAMWIEDNQGKRKRALSKPIGGRPVDLYRKEDVEAIEKKGVSPMEKLKVYFEFITNRPTRGY